jgi:NAD(P)-dependent dehydrogenase (short-subunit alcohol dehydrogenase family)
MRNALVRHEHHGYALAMPTALVTGASTGIGRATAQRLVRSGWTVYAGVRDDAAFESVAGEGMRPLRLDVTDAASVRAAADQIGYDVDRLDGVVNNAGIAVGGPLELVDPAALTHQLDVNVVGQVRVTQATLPLLRGARGRIVLLSSIAGLVGGPLLAPYTASKHAVEAIADALRLELRSSGIRVIAIEPGTFKTPIWDKAREQAQSIELPPDQQGRYGEALIAMRKLIERARRHGQPPERVADTIYTALTTENPKARYLIGPDARSQLLARRLLPTKALDALVGRATKL